MRLVEPGQFLPLRHLQHEAEACCPCRYDGSIGRGLVFSRIIAKTGYVGRPSSGHFFPFSSMQTKVTIVEKISGLPSDKGLTTLTVTR